MKTDEETVKKQAGTSYWRANVKLVIILLAIWALVSLGFGVLFADLLNHVSLFGFKLGFWFAQQGSILTFVILIFVYAKEMRKLDKQFGHDK